MANHVIYYLYFQQRATKEVTMDKIFRIGHRMPKNGVITIASTIVDDVVYYGASYCSPKEKQYNKSLGTELAQSELNRKIANNDYIPLAELKHAVVIQQIIMDILNYGSCPEWAESLLFEQYYYPSGLTRFTSKKPHPPIDISKIVVNNEYTKNQLILALEYIHHLREIDTDFEVVNTLAHMYRNPDLISVESS